jgi:hypothetical protein
MLGFVGLHTCFSNNGRGVGTATCIGLQFHIREANCCSKPGAG